MGKFHSIAEDIGFYFGLVLMVAAAAAIPVAYFAQQVSA